jgi:hypothetical protein
MGPLLYSTNTLLKYLICQKFRGDIHWVWCSEYFDSKRLGAYATGAMVAPSANPADIYQELRRDIAGRDSHSAKITSQKASLQVLAVQWHLSGELSDSQRDEIVYMVTTASIELWRPLIYVIPRAAVESRFQLVPIEKRAGFGNEYIIPDLTGTEFDILEL